MRVKQAKEFLKKALETSHNTKPVYEHSVRVFEILQEDGALEDVLIAGLLHDVVEDTDYSIEDIKREFGEYVAELVGLLTMDKNILDYVEQYKENFDRLSSNKEAITIRAADLKANRPYIKLADEVTQNKVMAKHEYFKSLFGGALVMTHNMKVDEEHYNLLKSGQKTIELRLFDDKRAMINGGDKIEFSNSNDLSDTFNAVVVNVYKADSFETLCDIIAPKQAGFNNKKELIEVLEKFYSKEKQVQFGVVGIEVKI